MHHDILTIAVSAVTAISAVALMEWMFGRTDRVCGWLDVSVIVHVLSFAMLGLDFLQPKWHCCCGFSLWATDGRFCCCKWQRSPRRLGSILVECCSAVHTNLFLKSYYTHLLFAALFSHT